MTEMIHPELALTAIEGRRREAEKLLDQFGPRAIVRIFMGGGKADELVRRAAGLFSAFAERTVASMEKPQELRQYLAKPETEALGQAYMDVAEVLNVDRTKAHSEFAFAMVTNWHVAVFHRFGKRVYEVDPALAERLLHTELSGVRASDLRLPYPSIFIVVPENAGLTIENEHTGTHRMTGIYITEGHEPHRWNFMLCGEVKDGSFSGEINDAIYYFHVYLPEDLNVEQAIEQTRQQALTDMLVSDFDKKIHTSGTWQRAFRWAMNVVLYATWPEGRKDVFSADPEVESLRRRLAKLPKGPKRDRLKERLKDRDPRDRIYLGRGTKPLEVEKAETAKRTGKPLSHLVLVSGHRRKQRHGPRLSLVKEIWIEPFYRGPEETSEPEKRHHLV